MKRKYHAGPITLAIVGSTPTSETIRVGFLSFSRKRVKNNLSIHKQGKFEDMHIRLGRCSNTLHKKAIGLRYYGVDQANGEVYSGIARAQPPELGSQERQKSYGSTREDCQSDRVVHKSSFHLTVLPRRLGVATEDSEMIRL